jgi:hypothetical protein
MQILTKENGREWQKKKRPKWGPGNDVQQLFEVAGIPAFLQWGDTAIERAPVQSAVLCNSLWSCCPCPTLDNPVAFSVNFVDIHWQRDKRDI